MTQDLVTPLVDEAHQKAAIARALQKKAGENKRKCFGDEEGYVFFLYIHELITDEIVRMIALQDLEVLRAMILRTTGMAIENQRQLITADKKFNSITVSLANTKRKFKERLDRVEALANEVNSIKDEQEKRPRTEIGYWPGPPPAST